MNDLWKSGTTPLAINKITTNVLTTSLLTTSFLTSGDYTSSQMTTSPLTTSPDIVLPIGSASPPPNSSKAGIISGVVIAIIVIGVISVILIVYKKKKLSDSNSGIELQEQASKTNTTYDLINPVVNLSSSSIAEADYSSILIKNKKNNINNNITEANEDQKYLIAYNEIQILKRVGGGYFGDVYKAEWRNVFVALKQIKEGFISENALEEFEAEAKLMQSLRIHPNVVLFYGLCKQPLCIITEFVAKGSLSNILESDEKLDKIVKLRIITGIARGMNHLSHEKIVHKVSCFLYTC